MQQSRIVSSPACMAAPGEQEEDRGACPACPASFSRSDGAMAREKLDLQGREVPADRTPASIRQPTCGGGNGCCGGGCVENQRQERRKSEAGNMQTWCDMAVAAQGRNIEAHTTHRSTHNNSTHVTFCTPGCVPSVHLALADTSDVPAEASTRRKSIRDEGQRKRWSNWERSRNGKEAKASRSKCRSG
eukprot:760392-Hanusia_phi.AAC.4